MQKTLYALIELQEVDNRLDELQAERGDLPLIVEDLERKINDKNTDLKSFQTELKGLRLRVGELNALTNDSKEKAKKYEEQLYKVKTNKEYDAITAETESVKKVLGESEDELLEITMKMEQIDKQVAEIEEELAKLNAELETNSIELNAKMSETAEEENMLSHEREIIVKKSSTEIIKSYEIIRDARDGMGIARIVNDVCGGCYSYIPPQKVVEVKKMKKIYTCEFCGRILVWDESNS
ncbi:MAG: zinc ribbon domain-containing protein [Calditrichaceae bacterium]